MIDNKYLEAQVLTAPPHKLHLMVVEGAIRTAGQGRTALEIEDYETAHFALNSSRDLVNELITGLNPAWAPELVERLKSLFLFVHHKLALADLKHDPQLVSDALSVLETHRESWRQLVDKLQEGLAESNLQPVSESKCWIT